jgi:hypothetical protein
LQDASARVGAALRSGQGDDARRSGASFGTRAGSAVQNAHRAGGLPRLLLLLRPEQHFLPRPAQLRSCSGKRLLLRILGKLLAVVSLLLTVTFACGVIIAVAHVVNQRFVAPVYDVVANLTAFGCAIGASVLLHHPVPAALSGMAILCWFVLARRTVLDRRKRLEKNPR